MGANYSALYTERKNISEIDLIKKLYPNKKITLVKEKDIKNYEEIVWDNKITIQIINENHMLIMDSIISNIFLANIKKFKDIVLKELGNNTFLIYEMYDSSNSYSYQLYKKGKKIKENHDNGEDPSEEEKGYISNNTYQELHSLLDNFYGDYRNDKKFKYEEHYIIIGNHGIPYKKIYNNFLNNIYRHYYNLGKITFTQYLLSYICIIILFYLILLINDKGDALTIGILYKGYYFIIPIFLYSLLEFKKNTFYTTFGLMLKIFFNLILISFIILISHNTLGF